MNKADQNFLDLLFIKNHEDPVVAIDLLYEYIDPILDNSEFERLDVIINAFIDHLFDLKVVIAFLTITLRVDQSLNNRNQLHLLARLIGFYKGLSAKQIKSVLKGL